MEKPSKTELPSTIRDIALFYVCHNLSFPWFDRDESKPNSFRPESLLEALKREALISSSGINLKKAAVLRSYGLFTYLNKKIEFWISKSKNTYNFRPMFLFISGHDLTLMYILVALGIYDGYLPYYASRVTFEILQHERKYYARILWNGNDVTPSICPQETSVYCDARFLTGLLDSSLILYFGTSNFWEACEIWLVTTSACVTVVNGDLSIKIFLSVKITSYRSFVKKSTYKFLAWRWPIDVLLIRIVCTKYEKYFAFLWLYMKWILAVPAGTGASGTHQQWRWRTSGSYGLHQSRISATV